MSPFPVLRRLDAVRFTSGESLALALNVSRASISLALRDVDALGISVQSHRGAGYRLSRSIDWLDEATVASFLNTDARYFDLRCFDQIDSTNTELMKAVATGTPSGMVYAAEHQMAGRGRRGRRWQGELGASLMFSLLWRFNLGLADLSGLSLAVGLAIVRALEALGLQGAMLKWPNDIVCQQGKLGGVLIELSGEAQGPVAAVIGIGLNVSISGQLRASVDQEVATLTDLGLKASRNELLAAILRSLADVLSEFSAMGFNGMLKDWEARHYWQKKRVDLKMPDESIVAGVVQGVSPEGALRIESNGVIKSFHSGEISMRGVL